MLSSSEHSNSSLSDLSSNQFELMEEFNCRSGHESIRKSLDQPESNDSLLATTTKLYNGTLPPELSLPTEVTFIVGAENPRVIYAHKFPLCIRSPVFHRMFNGQLAEASDTIRIPDLDPTGFENMVRYIYTDEITEDLYQFDVTFMAADKYLVDGLCDKLINFSREITSFRNCLLIYDNYLRSGILDRFDGEELSEMINLHAYLAFNSDDFLKIQKETLIRLLERNELLIDEPDLFSACFRWLKAEAERRKSQANPVSRVALFASFKHLIRFPLMSENEFFGDRPSQFVSENEMVAPAKSGLFTDSELQEFRRYYESSDPKALSVAYNFNKRNGLRVGKLIYDWRIDGYRMAELGEQLLEEGDFVYLENNGFFKDARLKEPLPVSSVEEASRRSSSTDDDSVHMIEAFPIVEEEDDWFVEKDPVPKDQASEIRLFKIQKIAGTEEFEGDIRLCIRDTRKLATHAFNNWKKRNVCYRKSGASYMAFDPVSLKTNNAYLIEFRRDRYKYNAFANLDLRLDQVFAVAENGEKKLDVRTTILRNTHKIPAFELYFLY